MKRTHVVLACALCLVIGAGLGLWADQKAGGMNLFRGKPAKEAGLAALEAAERFAGDGSWERIAVGRVYYLSGDKAKGQTIFDGVTKARPQATDWQRVGDVYSEAGEQDKAETAYLKALAMNPKDDTGQSEIGAWYIRNGQREKGEELFAKAIAKNPTEVWHYVRAGEAYLGVALK